MVQIQNIYLEQPPGYIQEGYEDKFWKLKKCLYGLKQASRAWYTHLADILTKQLKFKNLNRILVFLSDELVKEINILG